MRKLETNIHKDTMQLLQLHDCAERQLGFDGTVRGDGLEVDSGDVLRSISCSSRHDNGKTDLLLVARRSTDSQTVVYCQISTPLDGRNDSLRIADAVK
jgi:hypothetical protein